MKKFIIFFSIILLSFNVKALTLDESREVATFTRNFIIEGMKGEHIDDKGMPIFAYMQGPARIYGYQGSLYYVNESYSKNILIKSKKWNFDCSSFVSYVLKTTLYMHLLNSNYLGGNPYLVADFVSDRYNFDTIFSNIDSYNLLSQKNNLLPGDLIVILGNHIGMYVGDGEVAEASNKLITKYSSNNKYYRGEGLYNLGTGITKLEDFVNEKSKYSVLRIRKSLGTNEKINTIITWPDTGKTENLGSKEESSNDLEIIYDKKNYAKSIQVTLKVSNNHNIVKYAMSLDDKFNYQEVDNLNEVIIEIAKNGKYHFSIIDEQNNTIIKSIEIQNIDDELPKFRDVFYQDGWIYIDAYDEKSGLDSEAYSYDEGITWVKDSKYELKPGIYKILIRDKLGNINEEMFDTGKVSTEKKNNGIISAIIILCIIIIIAIGVIVYSIHNDANKDKLIV